VQTTSSFTVAENSKTLNTTVKVLEFVFLLGCCVV